MAALALRELTTFLNDAVDQADLLRDRLRNEVLDRLDRNLHLPNGLFLWLSWYYVGARERVAFARLYIEHFDEFWSPLGNELPDLGRIRAWELSYGAYEDVEWACLINPETGETSDWFDVVELERVLRRERQAMRRAEGERMRWLMNQTETEHEDEGGSGIGSEGDDGGE